MTGDHDQEQKMRAFGKALRQSYVEDSPDEKGAIADAIASSPIGRDAAALRANLAPDLKSIVDAIGDVNGRLYSGCVLIYEGDIEAAKRVIGAANDRLNEAWKGIVGYVPAAPTEDLSELSRDALTKLQRQIDTETEDLILDMHIGDEVRALQLTAIAQRRDRVDRELAQRRLAQKARRGAGGAA